jgi:hypothetical protein
LYQKIKSKVQKKKKNKNRDNKRRRTEIKKITLMTLEYKVELVFGGLLGSYQKE